MRKRNIRIWSKFEKKSLRKVRTFVDKLRKIVAILKLNRLVLSKKYVPLKIRGSEKVKK